MKQNIIPKRLFTASCFALITTAMTFAIRVKLEMVFNQDYLLTLEEIGYAFAPAFWGFTLAMMIGGFFVDLFGMKKIMNIAFFWSFDWDYRNNFSKRLYYIILGHYSDWSSKWNG